MQANTPVGDSPEIDYFFHSVGAETGILPADAIAEIEALLPRACRSRLPL